MIDLTGFAAPFVLEVENGTPDGDERVTAATVALDGVTLLTPSDFKKKIAGYAIPVTSQGATTTLAVDIFGGKGTFLTVTLWGTPVITATQFCPGSSISGVFGNLDDAVAATDPGGVVQVCDGIHLVDYNVTINKPITIEPVTGAQPVLNLDGPTAHGVLSVAAVAGVGDVILQDLGFVGGKQPTVDISSFSNPVVSVIIQNNRFEGAGFTATIRVGVTPGVLILDNEFLGTSAEGFIKSFSGNTVLDCEVCPSVLLHPGFDPVSVMNNSITVNFGVSVVPPRGLTIQGLNGLEAGGVAVTVSGNSIAGVGGARDPTDPLTFPLEDGVFIARADAAITLTGNQVSGARTGLVIGVGSALVTTEVYGAGNVISSVFTVVNFDNSAGGAVVLEVHRNDFTAYGRPLELSGTFQPGILSCNWWGDAGGPIGAFPGLAPFYTPFSTVPIANQPSVMCP